MKIVLCVAIGGACGSVLRYWVSLLRTRGVFPVSTLVANVLGCFLIGLFSGYFLRFPHIPVEWRLLLVTGLCGGFTTFSTFANEHIQLFRQHHYKTAISYMSVSLILGISACFLGLILTR